MRNFFPVFRIKLILVILLAIPFATNSVFAQETIEPLFTLTTANSSASEARWNADGTRLLTLGRLFPEGNTVEFHAQIWDTATGDLLLSVKQEGRSTLADDTAFWNADETRLITHAGVSAWLWDAETGEALREFRHESSIQGASWNSDESQILTSVFNAIYVWDAETGGVLRTIPLPQDPEGHRQFVKAAWLHDETQIFGQTFRGLFVWNAESGDLVADYQTESFIESPVWNRDMDQLAFGISDGEAFLWAVADDDVRSFGSGFDRVAEVDWNPNESLISTRIVDDTTLEDGFVYVWEVASGSLLYILPHKNRVECCVAWHPDGELLLSYDGAVHVWDMTSGALRYHQVASEGRFTGAKWSPDGTRFAAWNSSSIHIWDTLTGERIVTANMGGRKLFWSPDGSQLLTSTTANSAHIWQVNDSPDN